MKEMFEEVYDEEVYDEDCSVVVEQEQEQEQEQDTVEVYLDGFGFLPSNPRNLIESQIKRYATLFCCLMILYYVLNKLLLYPISFFFSSTGVNVVSFSWASNYILNEFNDFISFLIVLLIGYYMDRSYYKENVLFKRITDTKLLIGGICLTASFWVVANVVAVVLEDFFRIIGIINAPQFAPIFIQENISRYSVLTLIAITVLQEVFFRGVVLFRMKEFGETFAVVCSSLLFALLATEMLLVIKWFILGLPLAYFVLKSNNVTIAIILRLVCSMGLQILQILLAFLDSSSTYIIVVLIGVSSMLFGLLAYFKIDVEFIDPNDNFKASEKIFCFVSTTAFIVLAVFSILKAQVVLQFVS